MAVSTLNMAPYFTGYPFQGKVDIRNYRIKIMHLSYGKRIMEKRANLKM
jgi:hypothetical protein